MTVHVKIVAFVLAGIWSVPAARGDGECARGYRDTTPAERATMTAVLETAKRALPAAPEGWVVVGDDKVSVPTSLCMDYEAGPWSYAFTRYYQQVADQEARNKIIEGAAAEMAAAMEKKKPRLDAITAKMQELAQQVGAAAQKGDYSQVEAVNQELAKLSEEYAKIVDEGDTTAKLNAAGEEASRDVEMTISAAVNSHSESAGEGARNFPPPDGVESALRWSEPKRNSSVGHVLILIGPWKRTAGGGLEPQTKEGAEAPSAHTIAVRINADESRIGSMMGLTDFTALAALIVD